MASSLGDAKALLDLERVLGGVGVAIADGEGAAHALASPFLVFAFDGGPEIVVDTHHAGMVDRAAFCV